MMDTMTPDRFMTDMRTVMTDVELLLKQATQTSGKEAEELRSRASEAMRRAGMRLNQAEQAVVDRGRVAVRATDTWVHQHPWGTLGFGVGAAFLLGLLVGRR